MATEPEQKRATQFCQQPQGHAGSHVIFDGYGLPFRMWTAPENADAPTGREVELCPGDPCPKCGREINKVPAWAGRQLVHVCGHKFTYAPENTEDQR